MDPRTITAYDNDSAAFAEEWETQLPPTDMYAMLSEYFRPGRTADVGCGSGRDTAWLASHGFDAIGYDASVGLLAEARRRHPGIHFVPAALPELEGVDEHGFTNVLCETVIMHLRPTVLAPSLERLIALLEPGGTIYLSWRVGENGDRRDDHDRLYAAFDPSLVRAACSTATIVYDESRTSISSGKTVHRIIARSGRFVV